MNLKNPKSYKDHKNFKKLKKLKVFKELSGKTNRMSSKNSQIYKRIRYDKRFEGSKRRN